MASVVERFPPELDLSVVFVVLPWVPSAAVLTVAVLRPRLSSAPSAAG